jgi:hypothetical protein
MRRATGPWGERTAHLRRRAVAATRLAVGFGFSAVVLGLFDVVGAAVGLMALALGCASVLLLSVDELRAPDQAPPPATWLDGAATTGVLAYLWIVFGG